MKSLIVLRHAKSEHPAGVADFDRALNDRGKRDAQRVGEVIRERGLLPERIVTSAAKRARKTTEGVVLGAAFDGLVAQTEELYEASAAAILSVVRSLDEEAGSALIVGHNPGFWSFASQFGGPIGDFPTAAWARFEFDIEFWGELTDRTPARRTDFWYPRLEDATS